MPRRRKLSGKNRVRNARGTSEDEPPGRPDTWQKYWKKHSGKRWPRECRIYHCTENADVGAHVTIDSGSTEYIIPMCSDCNHYSKRSRMRVNKGTIAVREYWDTPGPGWTFSIIIIIPIVISLYTVVQKSALFCFARQSCVLQPFVFMFYVV